MSCAEPDDITFTAAEASLLHWAVRDLIARRAFRPMPLPKGFDVVHAKLVSFVRETKTCATQQHSAPSVAEELIDTNEAAEILSCTPQWVGRIRNRLGVREIGSQRVFPRQNVIQYAQRKVGQDK